MAKLFLLRHLKSQWNLENRFTGWTDVPLCEEGIESAKRIAEKLSGEKIDKIYTSPLIRNKETVSLILNNLGAKDLPIVIDKALDERNYGELQGLNKEETIEKYGEEKVHLWRRSWNVAPPGGESLENVYKRAVPFFKEYIEKDLKAGKNILVVASHNSLRAIVKYAEGIDDEKIIDLELPFGALIKYDFDGNKYTKFA
ncbi:MAG: 2,3-diphosphoglycerate-dependent phosphoglycerate mutase [Candidatus Staskawiczbacteria bacterium]|nr:2,3-diphosphoglycerate-dependent phosphoglycerate mutase [Candidatus Staskawiczbacteria bacterium]